MNGRADALVTCNLGHFAQGAARFRLRLARPGAWAAPPSIRKPLEWYKSYAWRQIRKAIPDRSAVVRFRSQQRRPMPQFSH